MTNRYLVYLRDLKGNLSPQIVFQDRLPRPDDRFEGGTQRYQRMVSSPIKIDEEDYLVDLNTLLKYSKYQCRED